VSYLVNHKVKALNTSIIVLKSSEFSLKNTTIIAVAMVYVIT